MVPVQQPARLPAKQQYRASFGARRVRTTQLPTLTPIASLPAYGHSFMTPLAMRICFAT